MSGRGLNPDLSGDEPASNHLTHGTALLHKTEFSYWKVLSRYFHSTVTSTLQKALVCLPGQGSGRIPEMLWRPCGRIESLCQLELISDSWTSNPVAKFYSDCATPVCLFIRGNYGKWVTPCSTTVQHLHFKFLKEFFSHDNRQHAKCCQVIFRLMFWHCLYF